MQTGLNATKTKSETVSSYGSKTELHILATYKNTFYSKSAQGSEPVLTTFDFNLKRSRRKAVEKWKLKRIIQKKST